MIEIFLRKLPAFKGKQRIGRLLFKKTIRQGKDFVIKGKYNCVYKAPNIKENIGFELFINGVYEKETIEFIISKLPMNGIFLDIGANIGAICLPICKQRNDIKAIAIEASGNVFQYLDFNFKNNRIKNCISLNKAVSDKDGELVSFFSPPDLYGKGSMAAVFTDEVEKIQTVTIDTLIADGKMPEVDFIKMDVEGFEYFAFKGAEKLLSSHNAPDILFEFVDWAEGFAKGCKPGDAQKLLLQYGYNLWEMKSNGDLVCILSPILQGSIMILASKKHE